MRLTLTTFLSLDGVMQAPGGPSEDPSDGFDLGGWVVPFASDDMGEAVWWDQAEGFLLGRRTYDIFASHWPHVTDPGDHIAAALNRLPKYVATRTPRALEWEHSTALEGDLVEAVRELKARPGGELQVHGSGDLAQTLIARDLIDEYRLFTFPVVLGTGRRLFADGARPAALRLTSNRTTRGGALLSTYEPAGPLQQGSFGIEEGRDAVVQPPE
jgi:dihydrofolate reductase